MNPLEWIEQEFFGNSVMTWALGAAIAIGVWMLLLLIRRVLRNRLESMARRRNSRPLRVAGHIVARTNWLFITLLALFFGTRVLILPDRADELIAQVMMIAMLVQLGLWASEAFVSFIQARREHELQDNPDAVAAIDIISFILRVAIWSLVLLAVLDNMGVELTTLIAGLGVGGIAVALAAQNILGDLFASLSIVLDKPFVVGDFLIIGDFLGTVERVGIKTTRIRSLSGEQLIFSNNDLLGSRIRNYGRMFERRVVFSLGVTYQTPADKLRTIPGIIRETIESQEKVRFDRAHFQKYGDFALIFEVVYFVLSADYNQYMDIQQAVNLQIYERFENDGIEFAYPTQTLFLTRPESDKSSSSQE